VARKTSDIALLLGSRGRGRSRSGFGKTLRGMWETWFGRSPWRHERPARSVLVPGWIAALGVLAAFAGGYLAGGRFGGSSDPKAGLTAKAPNTPMFFEESQPLEDQAFIVSLYPDVPDAEGRRQAKELAAWLVARDLKKAQPYLLPQRNVWSVAVYFANDAERQGTQARLAALQDVPDAAFTEWRASVLNAGEQWPRTCRTR
jgi:hypothetical protein